MHKNIKLKDYSRSVYFQTLEELKITLEHDFKGRHVAIHLTSPRGIVAPYFITVTSDGDVVETYGNNPPVNWDLLEQVLQ